jgi:hypothetical protein
MSEHYIQELEFSYLAYFLVLARLPGNGNFLPTVGFKEL